MTVRVRGDRVLDLRVWRWQSRVITVEVACVVVVGALSLSRAGGENVVVQPLRLFPRFR